MKKILGCIFCLVMLFVSTISFGGEVSIATLVESVKVMDMELTQGDQDALVLSVQSAINQKIAVASADQNMKATIDQVYQLVDASIPRLDAEKATKVVDDYCDLLMVYFETGNMALKDVQSATDKVLNLSGTKVIKQEGINQEHIKALLKEVTDKNALLQGQVGVEYQQVLKVANLDKMLLNVEKAYRVVNSEFNTYGSFKELGRSLQKQLVLLASTENVDLTLEADVVARLRKDNIGISVNHNGIIYQIPTAFLEKHIGDLKISIKPVAVDATTATAVTGGMIKPLLLREVAVGHGTNPESIMVHVPVSALQSDALVVESYALMAGKGDQWQKLVADMNYGTLTATIKASGLMGAGTYQA
ncbi:MAG: hypothetical protein JXO44_10675, partial [Clostridia bacterium]|nr:hypothetical protein [Clostridia bacterium]